MASSNLMRWSHRSKDDRGNRLHWERSADDGIPFRGRTLPLMPDAEYDARTYRVSEVHNAFFDTKIPAENQKFLEVLSSATDGWFQLLHLERFWRGSTCHYIEWIEYYKEDGSHSPYPKPDPGDLPYGPRDFMADPRTGA